jgi:phage I-like protein
MTLIVAALLATVPTVDATGRAQLLPAGAFSSRDGRPGNGLKWRLDDAQGARLAADINRVAALTPIVIDYEHQTLNSEKNGQPAPAAGWIQSVEWVNGKGMFAAVDWTERAKAQILAKEYRYISPVLLTDKKTARIVGVDNAALVNHPGLLGMDSVVAALAARYPSHDHDQPEIYMERAKLIALLALASTATDADIEAAVTKLNADVATANNEVTTLKTQTAALRGQDDAARTAMQTLQTEVTALKTAAAQREVDQLVTEALGAGKLLPAQRDWAIGLGKKDVESLKAYIAGAPVLALKGQSGGKPPAGSESSEDPQELARRALAYQSEQLKAGNEINTVQAMKAVTSGLAK